MLVSSFSQEHPSLLPLADQFASQLEYLPEEIQSGQIPEGETVVATAGGEEITVTRAGDSVTVTRFAHKRNLTFSCFDF